MAGMFAVYHGPKGLKYIANKVNSMAVTLADALNKLALNKRTPISSIPLW
jgi:glycine dehydrogenase